MNRDMPAHFDALFDTIEGAVILAQTVWFQDLVADARIVAASKEAAELYGYNYPAELEGKFTSELDHPDDYLAIKVMAIIRMYDLNPIPNEYDVRIILPDGSIRYTRKNVRQMQHDDKSYWVTRSKQISPAEATPLPDFRSLLTPEVFNQWFGAISVAELTRFVEKFTPVRNRQAFTGDLTIPEFQAIIDEIQAGGQRPENNGRMKSQPTSIIDEVVNIGLGQTRRLPDNRFIHRCANCAETWASSVSNPPQCPRSRDDSRGPRCGIRRWRLVTERGQACAAYQMHQTGEDVVKDGSK